MKRETTGVVFGKDANTTSPLRLSASTRETTKSCIRIQSFGDMDVRSHSWVRPHGVGNQRDPHQSLLRRDSRSSLGPINMLDELRAVYSTVPELSSKTLQNGESVAVRDWCHHLSLGQHQSKIQNHLLSSRHFLTAVTLHDMKVERR